MLLNSSNFVLILICFLRQNYKSFNICRTLRFIMTYIILTFEVLKKGYIFDIDSFFCTNKRCFTYELVLCHLESFC